MIGATFLCGRITLFQTPTWGFTPLPHPLFVTSPQGDISAQSVYELSEDIL